MSKESKREKVPILYIFMASHVMISKFNKYLNSCRLEKRKSGHFKLSFPVPNTKAETEYRHGVTSGDEGLTVLEDGTLVGRRMPKVYFAGIREVDGRYLFVHPKSPDASVAEIGVTGVSWARLLEVETSETIESSLDYPKLDFTALELFKEAVKSSFRKYRENRKLDAVQVGIPQVYATWHREEGIVQLNVTWNGDSYDTEDEESDGQSDDLGSLNGL